MRSVTFFNFLLEATLVGSVLIALMLPVRVLLRRKTGSVVVYAAWLLVALRLLLPLRRTAYRRPDSRSYRRCALRRFQGRSG